MTTLFLGDSQELAIELAWEGVAFEPGDDWTLIFTVKASASDTDANAKIQKTSDAGITVDGDTATIEIVPQDTTSIAAGRYLYDIQAQHITTGEVRTVAYGKLELVRDITRSTQTSIPIRTTQPPHPAGVEQAINGASQKSTPADADRIPLTDSAASYALKWFSWANLKATLKTYFDTLYDASGLAAAAQAFAMQRANHTGTQKLATISDAGNSASRNVGTTAGTVCAGDDSRLTDARTPTAHALSHAVGGSDEITPASIGAVSVNEVDATAVPDTIPRRDNGGGIVAVSISSNFSEPVLFPFGVATSGSNATTFPAAGGECYTKNNPQALEAHAITHGALGTDPITPADIGAQPAGDYIVEGDSRLTDARTPTAHTHTGSDLDYSGTTDIGAALADADEIMVSDGGGNSTRRKSALSRFWTYVLAKIGSSSASVVTNLSAVTNTSATTINLTASDSGTILRCTASTTVTVNMPSTDPGGNFSVGFIQAGTGTVTFSANGKTMNSFNSLVSIAGRHAWASVIRVGVDTYNLSGTLS